MGRKTHTHKKKKSEYLPCKKRGEKERNPAVPPKIRDLAGKKEKTLFLDPLPGRS